MVLLGYLLLAVIVAAVLFYAVIALLPDGVSLTPQADQRPFALPSDRRLDRSDLAAVRIPVALRGYRFAETDDLIDRLATEIALRDEELARLREHRESAAGSTDVSLAESDPDQAERSPAPAENGPGSVARPEQSQRDV